MTHSRRSGAGLSAQPTFSRAYRFRAAELTGGLGRHCQRHALTADVQRPPEVFSIRGRNARRHAAGGGPCRSTASLGRIRTIVRLSFAVKVRRPPPSREDNSLCPSMWKTTNGVRRRSGRTVGPLRTSLFFPRSPPRLPRAPKTRPPAGSRGAANGGPAPPTTCRPSFRPRRCPHRRRQPRPQRPRRRRLPRLRAAAPTTPAALPARCMRLPAERPAAQGPPPRSPWRLLCGRRATRPRPVPLPSQRRPAEPAPSPVTLLGPFKRRNDKASRCPSRSTPAEPRPRSFPGAATRPVARGFRQERPRILARLDQPGESCACSARRRDAQAQRRRQRRVQPLDRPCW